MQHEFGEDNTNMRPINTLPMGYEWFFSVCELSNSISAWTARAPGFAVVAMFNITGTVIILHEEANSINLYMYVVTFTLRRL
jgi:hypothetical protein